MSNYACFILSYKRHDNIPTIKLLRDRGYTGKIHIIVGDDDPTLEEYKKLYGEDILVFSKKEEMKTTDTMDNFDMLGTPVFARNFNFKIAKKMGYEYFIQLDDDYANVRWLFDENNDNIQRKKCMSLDKVFDCVIKYLSQTPWECLAFAQGGDFIGGPAGNGFASYKQIKRKMMNSFIFKTNAETRFRGRSNDDVNTFVTYGREGKLLGTISSVFIDQGATQQNSGGMTDLYLEQGTYVKSFYSVMCNPSVVKIQKMGTTHRRWHHMIKSRYAFPCILRQT